MIKEAIGFGATVDEAKEDAILKLGAKIEEDVQIEIISLPKKKVLGIFGGARAEVKAYVERPDKPNKKHNKPAKKAEAQAKPDKKEKAEKPEVKKASQPQIEAVDQSLIDAASPTGKAIAYLNAILKNLGCENVEVKAAVRDNGATIILEGEGLGVVIGHRGETLDALQHLVSLAANNSGGLELSLSARQWTDCKIPLELFADEDGYVSKFIILYDGNNASGHTVNDQSKYTINFALYVLLL